MTSHLIEQMVASAIGNNSISAQTSDYSVAQINNNLWNACPCGADHNADQHQSVMEGMPTDPVELVNDLMRMGHYSDRAQLMAQSWETNAMKADLWQLLEQGSLSHASESQKRICYDLIKMAGGGMTSKMAPSKMGKVPTGKPSMGSASSRADGIAQKGLTKGRMLRKGGRVIS